MSYLAGFGMDRRARVMSLTRSAAGVYISGGDFVPGSGSTFDIKAAIQPMTGRQVMDLPEGIREEARWAIWSRSALLMEDLITYKGQTYKLMIIWPRDEGAYYKAAAGLIA